MNIILFFVFLVGTISISGKIDFILNPFKRTHYKYKKACPRGYILADLKTEEAWKEGIEYATKILGYDQRVWIMKAMNWHGNGNEQWMIVTPTDPKTCIFPPNDLESFCVPNEKGKLAINSLKYRSVPSLCVKEG